MSKKIPDRCLWVSSRGLARKARTRRRRCYQTYLESGEKRGKPNEKRQAAILQPRKKGPARRRLEKEKADTQNSSGQHNNKNPRQASPESPGPGKPMG